MSWPPRLEVIAGPAYWSRRAGLKRRADQAPASEEFVWRVQDAEGRGPYRPGFSTKWSDPDGSATPPWWLEIGETCEVAHARMTGPYHWGCGFRTMEQLHSWFSPTELSKLSRLGFFLVRVVPAVIIAETPTQVVFGANSPLRLLSPRIPLKSRLAKAA